MTQEREELQQVVEEATQGDSEDSLHLGQMLMSVENLHQRCCTRTKGRGESGTRDMVDSLRHVCTLHRELRALQSMDLFIWKEIGAPLNLLQECKATRNLPVVNFAVAVSSRGRGAQHGARR